MRSPLSSGVYKEIDLAWLPALTEGTDDEIGSVCLSGLSEGEEVCSSLIVL